MLDREFQKETEIAVPAEELREWHFRPGTFDRLGPPWEESRVIEEPGELRDGARAVVEVAIGPLRKRWIAEHEILDDGFVDRQAEGPFSAWEHRHRFVPVGTDRSRLVDTIRYRLPFGALGSLGGGRFVNRKLDRVFRYRHETTKLDLERGRAHPAPRSLDVLVSGAGGMIGSSLVAYLRSQGHRVRRLTRSPRDPNDLGWDPETKSIDLPPDLPCDAVVHLAGESTSRGRWTPERKRRILESRRLGTRILAEAVGSLSRPPAVFVNASGTGYYLHDGSTHDESGPNGEHFLAEVCRVREEETAPARSAGIRVIQARFGLVLSPAGGLLAKQLPLFLAGVGGRLGEGGQRISWIAIDDVVDVIHRALFEKDWEGPINVTAPAPVPNREFAATLARVLHRPCRTRFSSSLVEKLAGEKAENTVLADIAAVPGRLLSLGYAFRYPDLAAALSHLTGRPLPFPGSR